MSSPPSITHFKPTDQPSKHTQRETQKMPTNRNTTSWHVWTAAQTQILISLWKTTDWDVTQMAEALSEDFGTRVRRKDVIMKLWLLDEQEDSEVWILNEERWRLSWPVGEEEVED